MRKLPPSAAPPIKCCECRRMKSAVAGPGADQRRDRGRVAVIIQRMEQRLQRRGSRRQAPAVWAAAYLLLGLRYSPNLVAGLFRGVMSMKVSSTCQAILEEGRTEGRTEGAVAEARKVLRLQADDA